MTLAVRPATAADAPALAALLNEIIRIGGTTAHEEPFTARAFTRHYLTGPGVICCHVAEAGGRPLGFQALERHPNLPEGWADIGTFVAPGRQGGGVGAALFAATRAAAEAAGRTAINATIRADNTPGLRYYARMGFTDYAADPDYRLQDGTRVGRVSKRFDLG